MIRTAKIVVIAFIVTGVYSCKKDMDPVFHITPSEGVEEITLGGLAGDEPGSEARNSVYLNLRDNETTPVLRAGWDLGFYNGNDYRVILNNASGAGVKVLDKYDLTAVSGSDTIGLTLAVNPMDPQPEDLAFFDDYTGDITKTAIPEISPVDNENPVIILNRGTGGGIAPRPWVKLRILRNGNGYTMQYAGIEDNTFKIINIPKDANFNFQFVSADSGLVNVEPEKEQWDIVWTYTIFDTNFGWGTVPYNFADMIGLNYLQGVEAKEIIYADAATATDAYTKFNQDSVAAHPVVQGRWTIGSGWRSTQPALGARQDRFYLIKDVNGNYYKFKAIAMGVGSDGGVRGMPEFKYALISQ